jgi:hypothetical protein
MQNICLFLVFAAFYIRESDLYHVAPVDSWDLFLQSHPKDRYFSRLLQQQSTIFFLQMILFTAGVNFQQGMITPPPLWHLAPPLQYLPGFHPHLILYSEKNIDIVSVKFLNAILNLYDA